MSRILVTGAAGFIGSHLSERLVGDGHEVVGVDNFDPFYERSIKEANLDSIRGSARFQLIEADVADAGLAGMLRASSDRVDTIVHLAARAGVRPSLRSPLAYVHANVRATSQLLELARELDAHFVFGSSSSVYGNAAAVPFREDHGPLDPISPYAGTKLAAESLCAAWASAFGLRCISLRFFTVIGARQRPDLALHAFTKAITEERPVPVFGDGSMRRDFTYVDDIVNGVAASIDAAGELAAGAHEVINLGGHATTSVLELIRLIEDELGVSARLEHRPAPPGDVRITHADVTKAGRLLGYRPSTPVAEGVRRFVHWFREVRGTAPVGHGTTSAESIRI